MTSPKVIVPCIYIGNNYLQVQNIGRYHLAVTMLPGGNVTATIVPYERLPNTKYTVVSAAPATGYVNPKIQPNFSANGPIFATFIACPAMGPGR